MPEGKSNKYTFIDNFVWSSSASSPLPLTASPIPFALWPVPSTALLPFVESLAVTPGSSPVPSPMPSPVPASPYGPAADSCIWICALRKLGNGDGSTVHEIAKLEAILLDALIIAAYVPSTSTPRTPPHMESPSSSSSSPSIPPLPPSLSSLSAASSPANRMITPSPVLPATSLSSPYHPKKEELLYAPE